MACGAGADRADLAGAEAEMESGRGMYHCSISADALLWMMAAASCSVKP